MVDVGGNWEDLQGFLAGILKTTKNDQKLEKLENNKKKKNQKNQMKSFALPPRGRVI